MEGTVKSFTIYPEYHELISLLSEEEQATLYLAIAKYMFEDIEIELNDKQKKIFNNLKRPLNKSKKRSKSGSITKENKEQKQNKIKKKSNKNQKEIKSKTHQDVNVYVNVNVINNFKYKDNELLMKKINEWLKYKEERKDKPYTEIGLKSLITRIENNVDKYGDKAVIDLIDSSMSSNYQGIIWEKLKDIKPKEKVPEWVGQDIKTNNDLTKQKELEDMLKEYQNMED